jgi:hypothetical protein
MNKQTFWKLIMETNRQSKGESSFQQELIGNRLGQLPLEEIIAFDNLFREHINKAYTWKLWAAAYIVNGGCSDDTFMDFRGWLIAQGEAVYTRAVEDPDSLVESAGLEENMEWEGFSYVATNIYEEKSAEEMPVSKRFVHPAKPAGEKWVEADLPKLLPRLSEKYG